MNIVFISGSHRKDSQSSKVSRFLVSQLQGIDSSVQADVLDLGENPLPLWDEGVWEKTQLWKKLWEPYSLRLNAAQGVVVISPEWGGMVPPGLKNFLLLCAGGSELAHKPALIVSVSAGINGAYPVSELRMSGYKNSFLCYLPEHLIIRNVEKVMNDFHQPESAQDESIRKRSEYSLRLLVEYTKALVQVRESGIPDRKSYPTGM